MFTSTILQLHNFGEYLSVKFVLPESPNCFEGEFICIHQEIFRVCIGDLHQCDMITDCDDGSDEVDCGKL